MARIRSVKPGFFRSLDINPLSLRCRLFFVGLWTYADDEGRGLDDARLLKADLWPLDDDVTVDDIELDLQALVKHDRIVRYTVNGRRYLQVLGFRNHQSPNKPMASKLPDPEEGVPTPAPTPEDDGSPTGTLPPGIGIGGGVGGKTVASPRLVSDPDEETLFAACWQAYPRHNGKPGGGGSRHLARKSWAKLKPDERRACVPAVDNYRTGCELPNGPIPAHFATWLNQRRWEDWQEPATPSSRDGPAEPMIDGRPIAF